MANSQKVAELYAQLTLQTAGFKAALGEATGEMRKFSQQTKREMEEAKGSIALLGDQIGVVLPRHLRTFVAGLPGVASAMSAAFDAVAVIALAGIIVEAGKKVAEFIDKNEEAARKNAAAWEKSTASLKLHDDELQLSTIKINNQIAALEGKPKNGLAEALAEARVEAEKLSSSLRDNIEQEQQLLKSQAPGMLAQLTGQAGFGHESTMLAEHQKWMSGASSPQQQQEEADRFLQALEQRLQDLNGKSLVSSSLASNLTSAGLPSGMLEDRYGKEIELVQQMIAQAQLQSSTVKDTIANNSAQGQLNSIQSGNEAVQDQLKQFQDTFKQKQATESLSIAQELEFWRNASTELKGGGKAYTDAYTDILAKIKELQSELFKEFNAKGTIENSPAFKQYRDNLTLSPPTETSHGSDELTAAIAKESEAQAQLNEQWSAAQTKLGLLTGAITPHEAALAAAAAHADDYRSKLAALEQQLSELQKNDVFAGVLGSNPENQAKETQVQTQISQLTGAYKIQALEDSQATLTTTWTGMIDSVWDELIKRAEDTQQELAHIATQFVDGINAELAKGMTGHKMDFSKVFENSAQSLAKTGLQTVEGMGLKALGLGKTKRDGSSEGSALFVQMVGGSGSMPDLHSIFGSSMPKVTGPSGMNGLASTASRSLLGMLNDSNVFGSLFGGRIFGSGGIFDHFAVGGDAPAGVPIRVGELGPEDLTLPMPGHITPNRDLHGTGGVTMQIDARGTDPSLTRANFQRALTATHAQAVHDASRAMMERQRRTAH